MADDRFAPLSQDGLEHGWRCLSEVVSTGAFLDETAVAEWAGGALTGLDLPPLRLERVRRAMERALVSVIRRARPEAGQPSPSFPPVLVRILVPDHSAPQEGQQVGAWGLFVVERLVSGPAAGEPSPAIDIYLYSEGEDGG